MANSAHLAKSQVALFWSRVGNHFSPLWECLFGPSFWLKMTKGKQIFCLLFRVDKEGKGME